MKIRPLHDRIIVQRLEEGEQHIGSIIIPDTAKEKPQQGKVLAVGKTIGNITVEGPAQVNGKAPFSDPSPPQLLVLSFELLLGLAVAATTWRMPPRGIAAGTVLLAVVGLAGVIAAFLYLHVILNIVRPMMAIGLAAVAEGKGPVSAHARRSIPR